MKSNTQNKKIEAITETTLVIGIGVGSETHYARAFDSRGIEFSKKPYKFSNSEAGFEMFRTWILDIKEKHEKDKVVLGMESTGHYWLNLGKFLRDNEMKPVSVNPHHVKKSKELDDNNPTKNDRKDPKVIAGLVKEGRYMIPYAGWHICRSENGIEHEVSDPVGAYEGSEPDQSLVQYIFSRIQNSVWKTRCDKWHDGFEEGATAGRHPDVGG